MPEAPLTMYSQSFVVEWVGGACVTVLVYDYLITLGQEFDRMAKTPWTIPKILFYLNRYLVGSMLVFNAIAASLKALDSDFCVFYLRWLTWTIWTQQTVVEAILLYRLNALYRDTRTITIPMFMLYCMGQLAILGLTIDDYVKQTVTIVTEADLPGCYAASVPSIIAGYWIIPVIIESMMFGLMLYKTILWVRFEGGAGPTLTLLARDSVVYFFVIFALLLSNLLMFEFGPPFLSSLLITPSNTAGCIAGSRMLLNIIGLQYDDNETFMEMTELRFAENAESKRTVDEQEYRRRRTRGNTAEEYIDTMLLSTLSTSGMHAYETQSNPSERTAVAEDTTLAASSDAGVSEQRSVRMGGSQRTDHERILSSTGVMEEDG